MSMTFERTFETDNGAPVTTFSIMVDGDSVGVVEANYEEVFNGPYHLSAGRSSFRITSYEVQMSDGGDTIIEVEGINPLRALRDARKWAFAEWQRILAKR